MPRPVSLLPPRLSSDTATPAAASGCPVDTCTHPSPAPPRAAGAGAGRPSPPAEPVTGGSAPVHTNVLRQQQSTIRRNETDGCGGGGRTAASASCRQCSSNSSRRAASFRSLLRHHCLTYHVILYSLQILLLFSVACQAIITDDLVVETTKGKIRGVTLKSATNR